jgi:hypothetical protein
MNRSISLSVHFNSILFHDEAVFGSFLLSSGSSLRRKFAVSVPFIVSLDPGSIGVADGRFCQAVSAMEITAARTITMTSTIAKPCFSSTLEDKLKTEFEARRQMLVNSTTI